MIRASAGLLAVSSGAVGLISYGCSLSMAHLLDPLDYAGFAAAAALLGTAGVASAGLIPLPLAHAVRAHGPGTPERERATSFANGLAMLSGVVAAVVLGILTSELSDVATGVAAAASALVLFAIAPVWGTLQGEGRFGRYALLTVLEVVVRLGVSLVVARAGGGAAGPIAGFGAGGLIVLVAAGSARPVGLLAPVRMLAAVGQRTLIRESAGIAGVQALLSAMTVADVVVAAALVQHGADPVAVAAYQAVSIPAKAPVWVAVSSALVGFPAVRAAAPAARAALARTALAAFVRLAVPATVAVATLPAALALLVLPARYAGALPLLPWLATAGAGLGATTVLATLLLAAHDRAVLPGLAAAATALGTGLAIGAGHGVVGLAVGGAAGALLGAVVPAVLVHRRLTPFAVHDLAGGLLLLAVTAAVLIPVHAHPILWLPAVALLCLVAVAGRGRRTTSEPVGDPPPGTLRIVHLAFEDPAMPGSGGGALRTAEIDRRLAAAGHHLTVLTIRHPAVRDRIEHHGEGSIRWVHIGVGRGRTRLSRLLGYVVRAPQAVRATPADLVVEDFFAPISSFGAPLWSGRPTVGVVQWLNARAKAREYHLPVHLVERLTVRSHRRLIAMSDGVAAELHRLAPRAHVTVLGNGFDRAALAAAPARSRGDDVLFVGRLERAQKGLDLLLDAWAQVDVPGRLVIAGTGQDETALRAHAERLGLGDRVHFAGWTAGPEKFALLASARLAVVPSRFETFGIVAVEALAAGTPVVAFDIPCLREVVPPDAGTLVPFTGEHAADAAALAAAIRACHADAPGAALAAVTGPRFAARFDWDAIASAQGEIYRAAVIGHDLPTSSARAATAAAGGEIR